MALNPEYNMYPIVYQRLVRFHTVARMWSFRNRQLSANSLLDILLSINIKSFVLFLIRFLPLHDPLAVHLLILFFAFLGETVNSSIT